MTSCSGQYSLKEQQIISEIPQEQMQYNKGIISHPNKNDIKNAISFGEKSKDNKSLMYAYIKKGPTDFWNNSDVYVHTITPLYLIAAHAREQAREYKKIDADYINYCKSIDAVKLSLTQQFINNFRTFPIKREIILLHNGERIKTLPSIRTHKGSNPFGSHNKVIAQLNSQLPSSKLTMSKKQLKSLEATYKSMGYTNEQINTYMGVIRHSSNNSSDNILLLESDNIYRISDLNKLGKYEIIFRTQSTNNLLFTGDKEIRFPINFSKFK